MSDYQVVSLGRPGVEFVQQCLSDGRGLSRCLLELQNLESGDVVTRLPRDANLAALGNFMEGGIVSSSESVIRVPTGYLVPKPNTDTDLAMWIQCYLNFHSDALCVMENPLSRPEDPWLSNARSKLLFVESDVYHLLGVDDLGIESVQEALREAFAVYPPLVGILSHGSSPSEQQRLGQHAELRELARRAEAIFVPVYDGETYLIWTPRDSMVPLG